jgi:hypothetical protein
MIIYYCIEKDTKKVLSAGYLQDTWGTITGMKDLSEQEVNDLTWANYPNHGFMTLTAALEYGVSQEALDTAKEIGAVFQSNVVKAQRVCFLTATDWKFRSDQQPSQEWIDYCQALRDITDQSGFPWEINWPVEPVSS